jgi:aldose 1-epimerase
MKFMTHALSMFCAAIPLLLTGALIPAAHAQEVTEIGGQKVVTITRKPVNTSRPEFTSITLAPGRGMEVLQITANFPGKGNVDVLASPDLADAKKMLDVDDTANGDLGYRLGAAFLVPYPNRIRGKLSSDGKTLTTEWEGHTLTLPANNIGKLPTAERHAMHGLILKAKTDDVKVKEIPGGSEVTGVIHAGDFGGHWLSKTDLVVTLRLTAEAVDATIDAKNVGGEAEPIAIAWHPYFNLPSGDRSQVRIHIPGESTAEVDGYDNVFPTGKIVPVQGTRYDMRAPAGVALGTNFFDDNWNHIDWLNKQATVKVIDPKADYGVDIVGLSPRDPRHPALRAADRPVCGHRAPVQLWQSVRQGVGLDQHRHGNPEARTKHALARSPARLRPCKVGRFLYPQSRQAELDIAACSALMDTQAE